MPRLFARVTSRPPRDLHHVLRTWQVFFIALTAVIGTGAFNDFARASATIGSAWSLIAIVVVGLIAAAFMEALSELLQIFRTVNPLVEYVHVFVDPALAKCVAGVYWFSYASFMAVQYVHAASYINDITKLDRALIFFLLCPAVFTSINLLPVQLYAWLETIFGALKLLFMLGVTMVLFYVAGHEHGVDFIKSSPSTVRTFEAFCIVMENVAFSFLGVESIAVMSYEAKDKHVLKNSSQIIAWVPLIFYLLFAIAMNMCFDWNSPTLQVVPYVGIASTATINTKSSSTSAVLLAAEKIQATNGALTKTLTAILIICALSAANTTLYISSRTLFGSSKNAIQRNTLQHFTKVSRYGIPKVAVLFSSMAFCTWLTFASLAETATSKEIVQFFAFSGSIGVLFVWGTTCLAYLRYWYWLWLRKADLEQQSQLKKYNRFNRKDSQYFTPTAYFSHKYFWLQPVTTVFGFLGCMFLVFVCPSAGWWGDPTASNVLRCYLLHFVVFASWISMKIWEWYNSSDDKVFYPWVRIDNQQETLRQALQTFKFLAMKDKGDEVNEFENLVGGRHSPPANFSMVP